MHALILAIAALLVAPATPKPLPGKPSIGKKKGTKTKKTKGKKKVGKKKVGKKSETAPKILVKSEGRKPSQAAPPTAPSGTALPGTAPSGPLTPIGLPTLEFRFNGPSANTLEFYAEGDLKLSTLRGAYGAHLRPDATFTVFVHRTWLNGKDFELSCDGQILNGDLDLTMVTTHGDEFGQVVGTHTIYESDGPLRFLVTSSALTHDFDTMHVVLKRPKNEPAGWSVGGCSIRRLD